MAAKYDPRAHGALCDQCDLCGKNVVPPEANHSAWICCVAEAPGEQEEKIGRPLVGPSGTEFDKGCRAAALHRGDFHITNTLLCRPPGNDLKRLLTAFNKREKARKKQCKLDDETYVPALNPIECCAPRLEAELLRFQNFITLGKTGTRAVSGQQGSILALRGGFMDLIATPRTPARKVMPTVHPSFVLRAPKWTHVFKNDLLKAVRWFRGEASWCEPEIVYNPTPEELRQFLSDKTKLYSFDIETDGIEALTAHIRCVAIGDTKKVMVIGFRSNQRPKDMEGVFLDWYYGVDTVRMEEIFREFFEDVATVKVGHNAILYDKTVLKAQMGIETTPIIDTILLYKSVESELPKNLAHVSSMYTEAPSWKTDREGSKLALGGESDLDLHHYCAIDVAVTAYLPQPLAQGVAFREQTAVWQNDQRIQHICADMHEVGMHVDQETRLAKEKELLARRHQLITEIRERIEWNTFNPASVYQMRDLLFGRWKLESHLAGTDLKEEEKRTGSGDLSTGDLILRTLLTLPTIPAEQREVIKLIRRYRKALKIIGTYVVKMRFSTEGANLGWDEDDDWVDQETRKKYGDVKKGITDPYTGRMHPGYSASIPVTGRLSSFKPMNAQNYPKALRALVTAAPGHVLVGADYDQLELRIAAALWQVKLYLKAFAEGKDPHSMTAFSIFGNKFCQAAGLSPSSFQSSGILVGTSYDSKGKFIGSGADKDMRNLSKAVMYACVDKDEHVVTLCEKGSKPISQLEVGEWTWCWSKQRKRYEPTEITEVVPRGVKPCVKVTFAVQEGRMKSREESVIVTEDHLCLLVGGEFKEAGKLEAGEYLMPFRRRESRSDGDKSKAKQRDKARFIYPYNGRYQVRERRAAVGIYGPLGNICVSHSDKNTLNSDPYNLRVRTKGWHSWNSRFAKNEKAKEGLPAGTHGWISSWIRQDEWFTKIDGVGDFRAVAKEMEAVAGLPVLERTLDAAWRREKSRRRLGEDIVFSGAQSLSMFLPMIIQPPDKQTKGGRKVLRVEPVGEREVWDIEVDHEDHNFALASGVFVHNSQYMATVETVHKLIQKTELPALDPKTKKPLSDGTTDLPYALLPLRKVRQMRKNWLAGAPEYEYGWQKEINEFRRQGYLREPVGGRRRDFLDGESPNELVNFKVQSGAAGLVNAALIALHDEIPLNRWGPGTGIINQCHDSIVIECPADGCYWEPHPDPEKAAAGKGKMVVPKGSIPWEVARLMEECMNQTHPNLPGVTFTAGADVGLTWKSVG
jgi:DNA polymerase I-like protein with 3'-5' exonuclease and polymerase domains/uracil-DNA glycosylase